MKTVRWKPRRLCIKIFFVSLASLICAYFLHKDVAIYFDETKVWQRGFILLSAIFVLVIILIYIIVALVASNRIYFFDTEKKVCIKGRKVLEYKNISIREQTVTQKILMLVTVELKTSKSKKIVLRDIEEKEVLELLKGE